MYVSEGDERYLSMEVLKGLDLFKLSAGAEVPAYQAILGPNDIFGLGTSYPPTHPPIPILPLTHPPTYPSSHPPTHPPPPPKPNAGASLYEVTSRIPLAAGGPEFRELREGQLRPLPPTLSSGYQQLVKDMLAPLGQNRPTAAEVVARATALLGKGKKEVGGGGGGGKAAAAAAAAAAAHASSCALPQCQAQKKRIAALEAMVLSLTGEG